MGKVKKETALKTVEVEFDDTNVPALIFTPDKAPVITANFAAVEAYLIRNRNKYKAVDFSTANIEDVLRVKKEMQVLRTRTEKMEKNVNDKFFNDPKKILKGNFSRLYALIAEVENPIDEIIEKEDQKRIDGVNFAIDSYIKEFVRDMPLEEQYVQQIERKKNFYNKTQLDIDTRNDILAQITVLYKKQQAEKANIRVIQAACAKDPRLSAKMFLSLLVQGDDVASILEKIDDELGRLNALDNNVKEVEAEAEAEIEDTIAYSAQAIDFVSDLPGRTRTAIVEITYPVDVRSSLTKLFEMLQQRGIKTKILEVK